MRGGRVSGERERERDRERVVVEEVEREVVCRETVRVLVALFRAAKNRIFQTKPPSVPRLNARLRPCANVQRHGVERPCDPAWRERSFEGERGCQSPWLFRFFGMRGDRLRATMIEKKQGK